MQVLPFPKICLTAVEILFRHKHTLCMCVSNLFLTRFLCAFIPIELMLQVVWNYFA